MSQNPPSQTTLSHHADDIATRFSMGRYTLRRKVLKLFGGAFHIYDAQGEVALYSRMKAFRLREDIRLYTAEDMHREVLRITTTSILDISAAYDVVDATDNQRIGTLKRAGIRSAFFRDQWEILDTQGQTVAQIREDSAWLALVRRYVDFASFLIPQAYNAELDGQRFATYKQNFNPFVHKLAIDFTMDAQNHLDPRLGLAAAVLLSAIEGRQN